MKIALPTHWTLRAIAEPAAFPAGFPIVGRDTPAQVPGCVHTDLLAAGLIPDPYLADHEDRLRWIGHTDWQYTTTFSAKVVVADERVDLVFEGLDTVARIELNGRELARTKNMHRSYRFDVKDFLLAGDNVIAVTFDAPLEAAEKAAEELGPRPHANNHPFNSIRKMACNYGWDWGPELVTAGIWKPVFLDRWRHVRVAGVRPLVTVRQPPGDSDGFNTADIAVQVDLEWAEGSGPAMIRADLAGVMSDIEVPAGQSTAVVDLHVDDAQLWWPRGYGAQPLHLLQVTVTHAEQTQDSWHKQIGFRRLEVDTAADDDGTPFTLRVNGKDIFALGANWIPDDCFPHRVDHGRYLQRISQSTEAGINLLRVWGGGIYESEDFYGICDELGVLVWQDFLFACAAYAEEEPLRSEVVAEAREAVTRLSSHCSLVIWNGCNENIWGYWDWGWKEQLGNKSWGLGYYTTVLPGILAELDPTRPYSPASPFSPSSDLHPNDPAHGSMHIWDVWNQEDYTRYREYVPRFLSEFGFQGPPTWATLIRAIDPDHMAADSPQMLLHQKAADGNGKLARGLTRHLPAPENFGDWHWATSLNQARAVQFGIEHFRSSAPRCAGTVVWQLNDCWPVTSWAAIDGNGRRKPLFYALEHAYADRLLTVQPRPAGTAVVAINHTDTVWSTDGIVRRLDIDGLTLAEQREPIEVAPRSTTTIILEAAVAEPDHPGRELIHVAADLIRGWYFFAEDKDSELRKPALHATASAVPSGYEVHVTAEVLVKDLALLADKVDPEAVVDEQLITLLPGESAVILVRSTATLDPQLLLDPAVLRSANQLLHA